MDHEPPSIIPDLVARNAAFAKAGFDGGLKIMPSKQTLIVGCVDPRVDPLVILGLGHGDAAVIRNIGGRVTPDLFATLGMLRVLGDMAGRELGPGWNLIVLHHTDCGIKRIAARPDLLASFFGCSVDHVAGKAVMDPHASVVLDVAALRANDNLSSAWTISGLVYDVATGLVETVVAPSRLRA